jgi:Isocitrate lyase family
MLAYNCSPSFNWKRKLDDATIARFQRELGAMGYKFQFITLAGFHSLNFGMFQLAKGYKAAQMAAYVELQEAEFAAETQGYTATRHQREVGAGYFDEVTQVCMGGNRGGSVPLTAPTGWLPGRGRLYCRREAVLALRPRLPPLSTTRGLPGRSPGQAPRIPCGAGAGVRRGSAGPAGRRPGARNAWREPDRAAVHG